MPDIEIISRDPIVFAGNAAGKENFFRLEEWRVKVDDREDSRIVWKRGEFVLIVALTPEQEVVVVHEYKQAVEEILFGLPAGGKKKDETPQAAALRELREETGYVGTEENCLVSGPFFNSPDKSTEKQWVVQVSNVVKSAETELDETETILSSELLSLSVAKEVVKIGLHRMALYEVDALLTI